jgi:DNA-binding NarL/FixJ family response regulator
MLLGLEPMAAEKCAGAARVAAPAAAGPALERIRVGIVTAERIRADAVATYFSREELRLEGAWLGAADSLAAQALRCTAAVADVRLLLGSGADAAACEAWMRALAARLGDIPVIAIGLRAEEAALPFLEGGAAGYLLEGEPPERLPDRLRAALRGEMTCSERMVALTFRRLAALAGARGSAPREPRGELSVRESEVARLVAAGLSNKEIAAALLVQIQTVKNHVHSILRKLNLRGRVEVARHL